MCSTTMNASVAYIDGYEADERWGTILGRSIDEDGPYWALRGNGGTHYGKLE